jgi:hypothetical protein
MCRPGAGVIGLSDCYKEVIAPRVLVLIRFGRRGGSPIRAAFAPARPSNVGVQELARWRGRSLLGSRC